MATYAELIAEFPLRPIRTDRQLDRASRLAFRLAAGPRLSREAADYLEVLSQLIETYEAEHHPIESEATPRELLQFLIDESGQTLSQVAAETGIQVSTLSEILHGKREMNVEHIRRLAARFCVEPGLFIALAAPAGAR
jgi:HTH-type transcriptional regulator / antitoxin HigA